MCKKRVVVTGMGCITPVGIGIKGFWDGIVAGENGIGRITFFDTTNFSVKIAGEVKGFDFADYGDKKEARRMDRVSQFAVVCAKMALDDALFSISKEEDPFRCGVCIGSGVGGLNTFVDQTLKYGEKGSRFVSPFFIPMLLGSMAGAEVSIFSGFKGPSTCVQTACASGTNALGSAYRSILAGDADVMLAGGTEAAVNPMALAGFANMKALSTDNESPERASRPFDKTRNGFVIGEGAGILLLEELGHALRRGAHIYAEFGGYGASCDGYHITAPDPEGIAAGECLRLCLQDGNMSPEEVEYINAHGTSTQMNDKVETLAIKHTFREYAYKIPVSSIKSVVGHLLGAAGGVEAIATVLTIANSVIPPTVNYMIPDTENGLDLDYVPNVARPASVGVALSNNLGFGGHNACVMFKRYEG